MKVLSICCRGCGGIFAGRFVCVLPLDTCGFENRAAIEH